MATITRKRTVLVHEPQDVFMGGPLNKEIYVRFRDPDFFADPEDYKARPELRVPMAVWEEMEKPTTVTVTIEIGDRLNDKNGGFTPFKTIGVEDID